MPPLSHKHSVSINLSLVPQVAEERALAGKCGNPRCSSQPLPVQRQSHLRMAAPQHGRCLKLSYDSVSVLEDEEECLRFCGPSCQAFMAAYSATLGDPLQVRRHGASAHCALSVNYSHVWGQNMAEIMAFGGRAFP